MVRQNALIQMFPPDYPEGLPIENVYKHTNIKKPCILLQQNLNMQTSQFLKKF